MVGHFRSASSVCFFFYFFSVIVKVTTHAELKHISTSHQSPLAVMRIAPLLRGGHECGEDDYIDDSVEGMFKAVGCGGC